MYGLCTYHIRKTTNFSVILKTMFFYWATITPFPKITIIYTNVSCVIFPFLMIVYNVEGLVIKIWHIYWHDIHCTSYKKIYYINKGVVLLGYFIIRGGTDLYPRQNRLKPDHTKKAFYQFYWVNTRYIYKHPYIHLSYVPNFVFT